MKGRAPTIGDVARHSGVSTATVSRALSAPERVSLSTRERIAAAVQSTGYTVNEAARTLKRRSSRTLLIAIPNIGNPFYSTVLDAVVGEASDAGYGVLVANRVGDDPAAWLRNYFVSSRADGLLLFDGRMNLDSLDALPRQHGMLPLVVSCDEILPSHLNVVMTDNAVGAASAVEHLIAEGHTRIGLIAGPDHAGRTHERTRGFRSAMARHALAAREDWIFPGLFNMQSGREAAQRFLALDDRPTAVFSANDEMLIGFLPCLMEHGIQCPRDISVVGYDDIAISSYFAPALTTLRQPREDIGRAATRILIDILEGRARDKPPERVVMPSRLIVRTSTAPLRPEVRAPKPLSAASSLL